MIVLDATNKSLKMTAGGVGLTITSVVAYWSIDSSNTWTPKTFEVASVSVPSGSAGVTILPPPGAGEVSRVVESVWVNNTGSGNDMRIILDVGGVAHTLAAFGNALEQNTTITLDRGGAFTRQEAVFATGNPTSRTQNVH